jgi:hypothetical protein
MAGLFGSPEIQRLAEDDPEEYYKQTPFVRSLWESRLPTWLEQAYKQDVKPAIDAASAPTMEQVLRAPYNLASGAVKGAIDTIDSAQKDPSDPRKMLELALMTGAGGLLGGAPRGSLGMFAGRRAKTANLEKMKIAQKMLDDGVERTDVWKQTGWMRGPDGKMRFEIDDSGSRFNIDAIPPSESRIDMAGEYLEAVHGVPKNQLATGKNSDLDKEAFAWVDENMHLARKGETSLPEALSHSDAFAAYPEAKDIRLGREVSPDLSGSFDSRGNKITVGGGVIGQGADVPRSTALHEFQHAIQTKEDFAHGGFPTGPYGSGELDEYAKLIYDNIKDIPANAGATKSELYQHAKKFAGSQRGRERRYILLAGEAEARNVQTRMNYSPEQRLDEPPWTTLDVPESDMIVRGATDGSQMSIPMDEASRMARAKVAADENPLLSLPNESKMIGREKVVSDGPDLKIMEADPDYAPGGRRSFRYVQYENGEPVGALQFMTKGPRSKKATIQNVYTAEGKRRQKVAANLLRRAQKDFDIKHSDDLTDAGRAFKGADGTAYSNPGDPLSAAAALQKQYEDEQLLKFLETGA